jgi:two-component system, chemotaxis family, protein-glutamate methylesterase/glutaminase
MTGRLKSQAQAQSAGGFAGTLRNIELTDIIQMCCLAGASICVRVRQDRHQGTLFIQDGDLVHAECESVTGVEAFFTVMGWKSGQFETLEAPPVAHPTIKEPYPFLLMEAARRADDERARGKVEPSVAAAAAPDVQKIRVLIVDDSAIMSKILTSMLAADAGIEVVGNAGNGEEALELMKQLSPDLITMDVNMPVMDGSTALKHIMIESPCPVLIMSNLASSSYATILSFLNLGAVDFMSKPVKNSNIILQQQRMVDRVHMSVKAKIKRFQRLRLPRLGADDFAPVDEAASSDKLVITISGVGGYLEMVSTLTALPKKTRATVLSLQSIPPQFAATLTEYLNARSPFQVRPLAHGAPLCPGRCYISTTGHAIEIQRQGGGWIFGDVKSGHADDGQYTLDGLLGRAAEVFRDRVVVFLLSGAEVGAMTGLRGITAAGGQIVAPRLEKCIMPATLVPVVENNLVTELFDPADFRGVVGRYCA